MKAKSQYPKLISNMNSYLLGVITYFDTVVHPARGKDASKSKGRSSKPSVPVPASPEALHLRMGAKAANTVRRNPAP